MEEIPMHHPNLKTPLPTEKPDYYDVLVDYMADPFDTRSYQDFAKAINITPEQLWRIRKAFKSDIDSEIKNRRQALLDTVRVQAWKALAKKIQTDTNALKLFFQLSGDLIERTETVNKYETVEEKRVRALSLLQNFGLAKTPILSEIHPKKSIESSQPGLNQ